MPVKRSLPSPSVESAEGSGSERWAAPKKRPGRVVEKRVESSPPPSILRVSSPVHESVGSSKRELEEDCLHRCYHCKKRIDYRKDVFMYRDLRFCTVECRYTQYAADQMEEASRKLKGMRL